MGAAPFPDSQECLLVTPSEATDGGADGGQNANQASVALWPGMTDGATTLLPDGGAELVLFLNGSGGHPWQINNTTNFYDTAARLGYWVIALSYRSNDELATTLCDCGDDCFFPTRETLFRGSFQQGASPLLDPDPDAGAAAPIRADEGIAYRLEATLRYLDAHDARDGHTARWSEFLKPGSSPEHQIAWNKVVVAGHSQGGGEAAAIAKLFHVARVTQLSATCDTILKDGGACPPKGTVPNIDDVSAASWTNGAGTWKTAPSSFFGLGAETTFDAGNVTGGDTTCFNLPAVWRNLGMHRARENGSASTSCIMPPGNTHEASFRCPDNEPFWAMMLDPMIGVTSP